MNKQVNEELLNNFDDLMPLFLAVKKLWASDLPDLAKVLPPEEVLKDILKRKFEIDVDVEFSKKYGKDCVNIKISGDGEKRFSKAMWLLERAEARKSLLYNSSLMNLTSIVEAFFAELIHQYFSLHPEVIETKEKVFSFEDLNSFGSITDARQHYLNCKVEEILYGSFSDWITFLKKTPKLSMGYLDPRIDSHIETFQRRNLIVHNGGRVNSIYLSKVASDLTTGLDIGSSLETDRKYLENRIDEFERGCVLIGAEFWKQLIPVDNYRAHLLNAIVYRHLKGKRWPISEAICEFMLRDKSVSETYRCAAQLNYWLCKKRQDRWNDINNEIELADFSAKALKFKLGFAALKEAKNDFLNTVPKACKRKRLQFKN